MEKFIGISNKVSEIVEEVLNTKDDRSPSIGEMGSSLAEEIVKPLPISSEESWKNFKHKLDKRGLLRNDFVRSRIISLRNHYAKIAAAIILLAIPVTYYFINSDSNTPEYAFGGNQYESDVPKEITASMDGEGVLPDGTHFWMDATSQVKAYGDLAKDSTRQVHAEGDVFFDVAHDALRPFIVYTSRCVITVLGTKFHLHDIVSEPEMSVTLYEGSVKLTGENLNYTMKPGQEVRINHQTGRLQLIDHNEEEPVDAPEGTIRGQLKGAGIEKLAVTVMDRDFKNSKTDTIQTKNGNFKMKMKYSSVRMVSITTLHSSSDRSKLPQQLNFFYLPGHNITIKGSMSDPTFSGYNLSEQQNVAFRIVQKPARLEYEELFKKNIGAGARKGGSEKQDYEKWLSHHEQLAMDFIRQHPDWELSAGMLTEVGISVLEEALNTLDYSVKEGPMKPLVDVKQKALEHHKLKLLAAKQTSKGQLAPDFELRDMDGNIQRLSNMRGKYVILDFWASWCIPCRSGMPDMKEFYKQHKDRLNILGIATWDVEEGWKRAVAELQLPWANVFTHKGTPSDIAARYAVKGLPTKILVSPKGEILLRYEGEDKQFYQQVEKLIK